MFAVMSLYLILHTFWVRHKTTDKYSTSVRHKGAKSSKTHRFLTSAYFEPRANVSKLITTTRLLFQGEFNPSILSIEGLKCATEIKRLFPRARYLASARIDNECENAVLGGPRRKVAKQDDPPQTTTKFYLLDHSYKVLTRISVPPSEENANSSCVTDEVATRPPFRYAELWAKDLRLYRKNDGHIVVSYGIYPPPRTARISWHMRELKIHCAQQAWSRACYVTFHAIVGLKDGQTMDVPNQKNIVPIPFDGIGGMLQNRHDNFLFLQKIRTHVDPSASGVIIGPTIHDMKVKKSGAMHLNGVSVHIRSINMLLITTHFYESPDVRPVWRPNEYNIPWPYVHFFVLLDDKPPYHSRYQSPPWCFPAGPNSPTGTCEMTQFVSATILDEDQGLLKIGYGVNDCDAHLSELDLASVLAFTMQKPQCCAVGASRRFCMLNSVC